MRGYLATVDSPGCDLYAELLTLHPSAKVILSVLASDEEWWRSFLATVGVSLSLRWQILSYPLTFMRKQTYLVTTLVKRWISLPGIDNGELSAKVHSAHNALVRESVPREKLLEYNVQSGWPELCEFLEVPVPEQPFPNM